MAAALAAIVVAAGAAGCGGSDASDEKTTASTTASSSAGTSSTTPDTTPAPSGVVLTRAEFTQQANRICRETDVRMSRVTFPEEASEFSRWGAQLTTILDEQLEQLSTLTPPEAQQADFAELREGFEASRDLTGPFADVLGEPGGQTSSEADELGARMQQQIAKSDALARGLGLAACQS